LNFWSNEKHNKMKITENAIENLCIERLQAQGYTYHHGAEIAQDGSNPQRESYSDVLLQGKLRKAVNRINPDLPEAAREEALKAVQRLHSPELITNNRATTWRFGVAH